MGSIAVLPAVALIAGASSGIAAPVGPGLPACGLGVLHVLTVVVWLRRCDRLVLPVAVTAFLAAGVALGADARQRALAPALRTVLDEAIGGFALESLGPEGDHDPILLRGVLREDAAVFDDYASLRVEAASIRRNAIRVPVQGGVTLSVAGARFRRLAGEWRAGRAIDVWVTFRRPARYVNPGVANFERDLALDGTALLASAKSALLVDVVARGTVLQEWAAAVRARVRAAVWRRVGARDALSGAIVTAILIGDRTGLPDHVRDRLQAAGTYHVIAISGGNIAILAALAAVLLAVAGVRGRRAAVLVAALLLVYAQIATAGPSVWRATFMAVIYLAARAIDLRTPPWQAVALAAALLIVVRPLDVRDVGFLLTFGATGALLAAVGRATRVGPPGRLAGWVVASLAASIAVEVVLLPVSAHAFSRVTSAGLVLNLLAVPLMGLVQTAGTVAALLDLFDLVAMPAGWIAHAGAQALVRSAALVDVAPWLTARVAPPGPALVVSYYAALGVLAAGRGRSIRVVSAAWLVLSMGLVVTGWRPSWPAETSRPRLRVTMLDVGQGEALVVEPPRWTPLLVDAGGLPFGVGTDIGARVVAPALWSMGIRSLEALLVTHGDPDHLGGALAVLTDFGPRRIWTGVRVPSHTPMNALSRAAIARGGAVEELRAGRTVRLGDAVMRVLHPPEPDWERPRVRNDDSVVVEVVYGDVSVLLTGDISAEVERAILPRLSRTGTRILKVAHHGSRTSSSHELLETWRPQIALISAGRGNSFGHPAPETLSRLAAIGARVIRTDLHGRITVETDGRDVRVATAERP